MVSLVIEGRRQLRGVTHVPGAKNAAIKMLMASLLTDEPCVLDNAPRINDVETTREILEVLGWAARWEGANRLHVAPVRPGGIEIPADLGRRNRMAILALGPLLLRYGEATIPQVGGCKIGRRPVDFHLAGLRAMGAEITEEGCTFRARATRLRGARIVLPYPSVSATEHLLMTATLAEGTTTIENAAIEPEVHDLVGFLVRMGARIAFRPPRSFIVVGVRQLRGATHRVLPDRNEVVTLAIAAAVTRGDVFVREARASDLRTFLAVLDQVGVGYEVRDDGVRFFASDRPFRLVSVEVDVHPGFMTDWQQPYLVLMTQSEGVGTIHETVYEDRMHYVEQLRTMGAEVTVSTECVDARPCRFKGQGFRHTCTVRGPTQLRGGHLEIPDLRAGSSFVIAGLCADGETVVDGVEHLDRGYDHLDERLNALGARIVRLAEQVEVAA